MSSVKGQGIRPKRSLTLKTKSCYCFSSWAICDTRVIPVFVVQVPGPVVDCGGEECQSCLSDCSSCRSCRLCGALAEACERKGVLMLG